MTSNIELSKDALSWKEKPCHFTWNLSAGILHDFEKITRNLDNDLKMTPDLNRVAQLLFRAYLEVSDRRLHWNVSKAREFLDEADDYIQNHTGTELQPGYKSVALLNRIWIEHKCHSTEMVHGLLRELDGREKLGETDNLVVNTLLANALTRLGPTMITRSLQIYEEALQKFPNNAGFLFGALLMTGRKMRFERPIGSQYEDLDDYGKELADKEKQYCEELIKAKDKYQYGRSYLGLNLSRRRGRTDEARKLLEEAHKNASNVEAVFNNLMRFYRRNDDLDLAISKYLSVFSQPNCNLDVPESHHQLALCYISKAKVLKDMPQQKLKLQSNAIEELDKCLKINPMHFVAALKKAQLLTDQDRNDDAQKLYEDNLTKSEHYSTDNKLNLYSDFATFLTQTGSSSSLNMWQKVMDTTVLCEYLDNNSCKWKVRGKAKKARETAFEKLSSHYLGQENENLLLGILHCQNLDFEKALQKLGELDPRSNLDIPRYLAEMYLKWGREKDLNIESEAALDCYEKARQNVLHARELGLNQIRCRELLSDTALYVAHINLFAYSSFKAVIQIESECIESYREAVRCGSLVASVEVVRLIEKEFLQKTPRSKFLQILAEIDICCSQRLSDCLHRELRPRSFENGPNSGETDIDTFALDCKMIKRDILTMLHQNTFFRQAWVQQCEMEKKVLEGRFQNYGELELDGRKESSTRSVSEEEVYAATACCEKLRPLLDHIIVKFEKEELGLQEERKKQYFPLILGEKDPVKTVGEVLQEKLQSYFEIKFEEHYPNLYQKLLQVQPNYNPRVDFLQTFYTLVNYVKHSGIQPQGILKIVQDPVTLARQCIDKVEEICNFFFDAMKESSDLREKVKELVADLENRYQVNSGHASPRQEMVETYKKADELFGIISRHKDFVVRTDSTWKLLEMLALIRQIKMHSDQHVVLEEEEAEEAEGTWDPSKNLRKSHLELEVSLLQTADPSANEVLEKCRDTCKEADRLLNEVMEKYRQDPQDDAEVEFPFRDLHPGSDISCWKGKVKKHIKKYLKEKRINSPDELLKVMLQAQPCSSEENYGFLLMRQFLTECDSTGDGGIPISVSIQTADGEERALDTVELTRWCTNNAEKIAYQAWLIKS